MSQYKITLGIGQTVMGATESYYTADGDGPTTAARLNRLLAARNKLLFQTVYWTGVRLSLYGSKRRSTFLLPGQTPFPGTTTQINVPGQGSIFGDSVGTRPDQFRAILQWLAFYDTDRQAIRYLSNIPDKLSATEPLTVDLVDAASWFQDFQKFTALLVNDGWCIRAKNMAGDGLPVSVKGIQAQATAPFLVGIRISAIGAPTIAIGDKIALAKFRAAKHVRASTLNGTWQVASVDTGSDPGFIIVYLLNSGGIDPSAQRFTDASTLQKVSYGLFPIQKAYYNRVGIHKRGRPLGSPVGRRPTRASLDP